MTRGRPALLLMLLALALPPAALAQSAGDDQYQDPFGSDNGSGATTQPSTPSRPAQSGGDSTPSAPSASPKQTRSVPLARTGFDAWIPAVAGFVLLAGGVLLLFRPRRRRT